MSTTDPSTTDPSTSSLDTGSPSSGGMTCRDAAELLPWLVNGSLEADERQALEAHLASCESCRGELEETIQAWSLLTRHIPTLALAEYARGLEPADLDRERIERHLAQCPSCRQELEWATFDGDEYELGEIAEAGPAIAARGWGSNRSWRPLAMAASLTAMVATGALLWRSAAPPATVASNGVTSSAQDDRQPPSRNSAAAGLFADGFESGRIDHWSLRQGLAGGSEDPDPGKSHPDTRHRS